jgi:predicted lipoprotein with Yx(FWY)xxD motif
VAERSDIGFKVKEAGMSSRRSARLRIAAIALVAIAASVAIAACGDDDSDSDTTAAGTTATAAAGTDTISVQSVGGLDALVDADGNALYFNDQDTKGKIACTGECASIWLPATSGSGQPSSDDSSVEAKLGVVSSPDGSSQITYEGKPLYTFTEDTPGEVTGDGFVDSFAGVTFTWTAAAAGGSEQGTGSATTETETTETEDSGSSGGGGYGY